MKSNNQFRVRYQETDQMGIVHNSVYFVWFEIGRTEWMRGSGLSYRECEEKGWFLPVIESGCRYLSPARYDDEVSIETELTVDRGASFVFRYIVRNLRQGTVLAEGFTKHVCISKDYRINKEATRFLQNMLKGK